MKATSFSGACAQQQLAAVLTELAERVRPRVPEIQCRIQYGANDRFPWWVVARFSNPANDGNIVDVSVECSSAGSNLRVQADLAREDGTVLQEFLPHEVSARSMNGVPTGPLEEALRELESFLLQQVDSLSAELAE